MTDARDVVLVTVDSFRADRCGFLGSDAGLTPAMDRLANEGLVFENAISSDGSTSGSSSSFFTGRYPLEHDDASNQKDAMRQNLKAGRTLPQRFKDMGYRTAGFTANPWTSRYFGYDAGFDHFEDFMDDDLTKDNIKDGVSRGTVSDLGRQLLNWWQGQDMYMSWDAYYDQITSWLDEARRDDEPFFLWIFLVDVHMPYLPPKGYRSQSSAAAYAANAWLFGGANQDVPLAGTLHDRLVQAYDDTVRFTDEFVDRMSRAIDDDTLLCVHADHGESFGERDGHYGHGLMYEDIVHVPLFVANHPKTRVKRPFQLEELPDLLTRLAAGETIDETEGHPVVTTRNNAEWRLARGESWRYMRTPDDERLESTDETPIDDDDLLDIGRQMVDHEIESENERRRIIEAAGDLTDAGEV